MKKRILIVDAYNMIGHWPELEKLKKADRLEGVGRMAYSDLDDVDYLVEDNVMDEFCLSPEMEETHGRMAHWRCKLGTKCKCWE